MAKVKTAISIESDILKKRASNIASFLTTPGDKSLGYGATSSRWHRINLVFKPLSRGATFVARAIYRRAWPECCLA